MKGLRTLYTFALVFTFASVTIVSAAGANEADQIHPAVNARYLYDLVRQIQENVDTQKRTALARELRLDIDNMPPGVRDTLDLRVVNAIAELLRDDNDSIRFYAAIALGRIGPRARSTFPALSYALAHPAPQIPGPLPLEPEYGSSAVIPMSIKKINGSP